jgi:hypothetical protein
MQFIKQYTQNESSSLANYLNTLIEDGYDIVQVVETRIVLVIIEMITDLKKQQQHFYQQQ